MPTWTNRAVPLPSMVPGPWILCGLCLASKCELVGFWLVSALDWVRSVFSRRGEHLPEGDRSLLRGLALIGLLALAGLAGMDAVRAADLLRVDGNLVKWAPSATGTTTTITYAVLSGPYVVSHGKRTLSPDNCGAMQPFSDIVVSSSDVSEVDSRRELRSAFTAWEEVADVEFVEVGEPRFAHIVVGATETPAGRAFANLSLRGRNGLQQSADKALGGAGDRASAGASVSSDDKPVALIEQAFVCLNPKVRWKIGFDGNLSIYDLRHTFMHEIGHAIGLDHPGRSGSVMGFRYDESVRGLQPSDIAAVQALYGPAKSN